ncbi:MAG: AMP-dependent synthetase/ligase [bacterium]
MDAIDPESACTLHGLYQARIARTPDATAYVQHCASSGQWREYSWRRCAHDSAKWRRALAADGIAPGERAAIRLRNRREWVLADQACLAAGLVVVPLYFEDSADNLAYVLAHAQARLCFVDSARMLREMIATLPPTLRRVVVIEDADELDALDDARVMSLPRWLARGDAASDAPSHNAAPDDLATIVYTSGTTGRPKGVMLSHRNILSNAYAGLRSVAVFPDDQFLSFLPLSHMFERTVGYYLPMMAGATVAFSRSVPELAEDMAVLRPSVLIAVPRIFERAHGAIQSRLARSSSLQRWLFAQATALGWRRFLASQGRGARLGVIVRCAWRALDALVARKVRARFGGDLRFVISGGAPLAASISKTFIALGIDVLQGYGMTETGPTLSVNTPARNKPSSIGLPLHGTEIRLCDGGELHARGASVMLGYWRDDEATRASFDHAGWFASGDLASIDEDGFISIVGRRKEIIVTATGEKAPPADMEAAICDDPLFEQAMVIGEGRSYLAAVIVLDAQAWAHDAAKLGLDADDAAVLADARARKFALDRIARRLRDFPAYAAVRRVCLTRAAWTVQDGALTPTLKIKRAALQERFKAEIERMYEGH